MFRSIPLKTHRLVSHISKNQRVSQAFHPFFKRNVSSSAASPPPKEKLKAADMIAPISRVFLYAFLTYSTLHAIWWNLEYETKEIQYKKELDDLEKQICEKVAKLESQAKGANSQLELGTNENAHINAKKSWFW